MRDIGCRMRLQNALVGSMWLHPGDVNFSHVTYSVKSMERIAKHEICDVTTFVVRNIYFASRTQNTDTSKSRSLGYAQN